MGFIWREIRLYQSGCHFELFHLINTRGTAACGNQINHTVKLVYSETCIERKPVNSEHTPDSHR